MRRALLAVAAVLAGTLVVPSALTAAGSAPAPAGDPQRYVDPAQADRPTVSVTGTLTRIASEVPGPPRYGVETVDGTIVGVSLDRIGELHGPRPFTGRIALDEPTRRRAGIRTGTRIAADTPTGRAVLADAGAAGRPLAVESAQLGAEPTRAAATASPHRLYVAVITNRGALDPAATIAGQVEAMRTYWQTESDGLISSFTEPLATVRYDSTAAAPTTSGCGLGDPTPVWNEAAARFPGVSFSTAGNHLLVAVSAACSGSNGAGIGTVGSSLRSGGRSIVSLGAGGVQIGAHELGHNLSLEHANAEHCATTCSTDGYRNLYSVMGLAISGNGVTPPALDTSYRLQEGIATAAETPAVTASTTVRLAARATSDGVRGFTVTEPVSGTTYVVEYRSGTGRDSTAFYAGRSTIGGSYVYRPGVVIERVEGDRSTTLLTRTSAGKYLTSWLAGETFTSGRLTLAVTAATPSVGADVTITLDGTSPSPTAAPTSSPSPTPTTTPTTAPPSTPTTTPSSTPTPSAPPAVFAAGTPTVAGRAQVGVRLAASPGRWTPAPTRFVYQWSADGAAVRGATGSIFTPTAGQLGRRITVRVVASRAGYPSAARTSAASARVASGRLSTRAPTIAGTKTVGRVLTARTGAWSPAPGFTFRWYAAGRPISRATGATLRLTKAQRGRQITVRVIGSRSGYVTVARDSARSARVR